MIVTKDENTCAVFATNYIYISFAPMGDVTNRAIRTIWFGGELNG